jgi:hypothetical protein
MLLSENYFILTFKRASSSSGSLPMQELSVTEFYHNKEEADTIKLLKDYYFKDERLTQTQFSSFSTEAPFVV